MRAAIHNARTRKDGTAFCASHNDRTQKANSVVGDSGRNRYYIITDDGKPVSCTGGFEEHEKNVYTQLFTQALDAQNERHRKSRHLDRIKTIDDLYTSPRTCPEEVYMAIGKMGEKVDFTDLKKAVGRFCQQMIAQYGKHVRILDVAFHTDEVGQIHAQMRRVYVADGKDGQIPSERQALEQLGIPIWIPDKKESVYNNRKISFTHESRDCFLECVKAFGYDIVEEPERKSKSGMDKETYVMAKLKEEKNQLQSIRDQLVFEVKHLLEKKNSLKYTIDEYSAAVNAVLDRLSTCFHVNAAALVEEELKRANKIIDAISHDDDYII